MGGAQSCSCACDAADDLLLSLASRCTNPSRSSVHHEDDDPSTLHVRERDDGIVLTEPVGSNNGSRRGVEETKGKRTKDINSSGLASLLPVATGTDFDLTKLHPLQPPFLGSANEDPGDHHVHGDDKQRYQVYRATLPSLFTDASSPARLPIGPSKRTETPESVKSILTTTTASSDDGDECLDDFQTPLPIRLTDGRFGTSTVNQGYQENGSRDLAIATDELISAVHAGAKGKFLVPVGQVTPKRLFEGRGFEGVEESKEEDGDEGDLVSDVSLALSPNPSIGNPMTPQRIISSQPLCGVNTNKTCGGSYSPNRRNKPLIYNGVLIHGIPESPTSEHNGKSSPSRYHSSLPSKVEGCPIRLRIADVAADAKKSSRDDDELTVSSSDYFSFRLPFFSASEYAVTTPSNRPWGNGIVVKTDDPNRMKVEDRNGNVVAIMRNRNTFVPSHVIYSTRPRYPGQQPRSHRGDVRGIGSNDISFESAPTDDIDGSIVHLYPWALVKKIGRKRSDFVSIHMAIPDSVSEVTPAKTDMNGFSTEASFRGRHGFDGHGGHSHTVVSRIECPSPSRGECAEEKEVPCCLIFRNPAKEATFDATIAPGIDPVLVICYLTLHARMDSEPGHVHN
mmetsp:Transcript_37062/g.81182  ORF Transcript_37062/g.81182 Transcript_37062/m.81182 type:complete len:622 (+) Transcript_37062:311-2176(+)